MLQVLCWMTGKTYQADIKEKVTMQQRTLGRTGIQVGEIGMGCEGFMGKTAEQVMEMVDVMDAAGVSCIDLYTV